MQDYAFQIHDLFEDDSFPPIVVFSGKWGIGKTFYVQNHLTPKLVQKYNKKVHYLSLMGITSIEDFKDLLVSKVYLEEKHDKTATTKLFDVFSAVEKQIKSNTTISGVIKGTTGAAKHYMLKNINDAIFIVDDIERLENESLKKAILGECLTLSEKSEDKKNRFLIVTDIDALNIELSFREKIISEVISFEPNASDLFKILKPPLVHFKDNEKEVVHHINTENIKNLRVLSRLLSRAEKLMDTFSGDNSLDLELIKLNLLQDSFHVSKSYYINNMLEDEILKPKDNLETISLKVRQSLLLSEDFVKYFCGKTVDLNNILNHDNLPIKGSNLDALLYTNTRTLDERTFNEGVVSLRYYITQKQKVHVDKFFECCFLHEYLVDNGYINPNDKIAYEKIEKYAKNKEFVDSPKFRSLNISDSYYEELYKSYKNKLNEGLKEKESETMFEALKQSFKNSPIYINQEKFQSKPILGAFSEEQWKNIIEHWTAEDFGEFSYFIFDRYKASSPRDWLIEEKEAISLLVDLIKNKVKSKEHGFFRGNLTSLLKALNVAQNFLNSLE